ESLDLGWHGELDEDLLVFFHPDTLRAICGLREQLLAKEANGTLDAGDEWIRMVAINRLTGHSPGFFSVYTLPPNQATSAVAQRKINEKRKQTPPSRDIAKIILKKSKSLMSDCDSKIAAALKGAAEQALLVTGPAA